MSETAAAYITGDSSGVALPEVVEWPEIETMTNAPDPAAAIRALFEEVIDDVLAYADSGMYGTGNAVLACERDVTDYRKRLDALLAARG